MIIDHKWFYAYAGNEWLRGPRSWGIGFALFPRGDLMDEQDAGRRILVGLCVCAGIWLLPEGRPRFWRDCWSDVDEITTRVARRAGVAI